MTSSIREDRAMGATEVQDLTAIEQLIEQLVQERHRLAVDFDALVDRIRESLEAGRSPLAQIAELDQLNRRIQQADDDLTAEMMHAAKKI